MQDVLNPEEVSLTLNCHDDNRLYGRSVVPAHRFTFQPEIVNKSKVTLSMRTNGWGLQSVDIT